MKDPKPTVPTPSQVSEPIAPPNTRSEEIAEQIRLDLLSRRYDKGESLREEALARRFKVSRVPVRDALLQLTKEGLLVARPNFGVRVSSIPDDEIQPLIVKLRQEIEEFALDLMFKRIGQVPMRALKGILRDMKAACRKADPARVVPCDMSFHRFIIDQSGCPKLLPIWLPITSRMMLHYSRLTGWMDSYCEHENLAKAIFENDPKEARRLLLANIA